MGEGKDGKVWMEETQARAKADFAQHEMKVIGPGHWRIQKLGTGVFWCDIVVMGNVGLAVWGDIEGCFFSYCSGARSPEAVVSWMAHADVSYYGRQKAHIGMSGSELVDEYVDDVALYDLDQRLEAAKEEHDEDQWNEPRRGKSTLGETYTEAINDAKMRVGNGDGMKWVHDGLMEDLRNEEQDCYEWVYKIGQVTSCRVIYALAAVSRLNELLLVQDSDDLETSQS